MRTLVFIAALVASRSASAGETPTEFMERYVAYFNAEDSKQYQEAFEFPVTRFVGGVLEILSDPLVPMANFENIKKTGWVTSRIGYVKSLSESPQAAMVELSFVRVNSSGNPFFEATGITGLLIPMMAGRVRACFL